jgi:hypothetical protein
MIPKSPSSQIWTKTNCEFFKKFLLLKKKTQIFSHTTTPSLPLSQPPPTPQAHYFDLGVVWMGNPKPNKPQVFCTQKDLQTRFLYFSIFFNIKIPKFSQFFYFSK